MVTDPESLLPLHPLAYEILIMLMEGPAHAYLIVKRIEEESRGTRRIMPANLYRRLRDMLEQGLLEERPAKGDDRRHRDFRLTPLGRRVVRAEARRLQAAVELARAKGLLRNA